MFPLTLAVAGLLFPLAHIPGNPIISSGGLQLAKGDGDGGPDYDPERRPESSSPHPERMKSRAAQGVTTPLQSGRAPHSFFTRSLVRITPGFTTFALTPRRRSSFHTGELTNAIASAPNRSVNFLQPV